MANIASSLNIVIYLFRYKISFKLKFTNKATKTEEQGRLRMEKIDTDCKQRS